MEQRVGKCISVGSGIGKMVSQLAGDSEEARINIRVQQVRDRYRAAIESVYPPSTAHLHLAHTNNVIITMKKGARTLIVYVDDSLFAAELNAQRELIKLQLLEQFGEQIDDFQIKTSQWRKYRERHPYADGEETAVEAPPVAKPLDERERAYVSDTASKIEDDRLRKSLERAMTADLEWKKGETMETTRKNPK